MGGVQGKGGYPVKAGKEGMAVTKGGRRKFTREKNKHSAF